MTKANTGAGAVRIIDQMPAAATADSVIIRNVFGKAARRRLRRVFNAATIETIRRMAKEGKSASQIAEVVGSTAASVRVKCSELKIRLIRRGRPRHGDAYTQSVVEFIRRMAAERKSAAEIAKMIGSTAEKVRVKCSELKIKLPRLPSKTPCSNGEQMLCLYVSPTVCDALARKGALMHRSAAELARMLLEAVVTSNIYEAVLDETE